jgi:hypothetical protein
LAKTRSFPSDRSIKEKQFTLPNDSGGGSSTAAVIGQAAERSQSKDEGQ